LIYVYLIFQHSSKVMTSESQSTLRTNKKGARNLNIFNVAANSGTCGSGNVGNGICANVVECCSSHGWCGVTADHCGGSSTGGTCGSGNVGNGICAMQENAAAVMAGVVLRLTIVAAHLLAGLVVVAM
jgi:hypothetical protein